MPGPFPLLIDGNLVEGVHRLEVINPATEEPVATASRASADQFVEAIEAAQRAFPAWSAKTPDERSACMIAMAEAIEGASGELIQLLVQEQGKPTIEATYEVIGASMMLRHFAALALTVKVIQEDADRRIALHRVPLGVVAAIAPWNFPFVLMVAKIAPALAAGNTVVAKPAPTTPLTALRLGALVADILPRGVLNIVTDANELGGILTSHPAVRKISFTGSTATGRKVMASAAPSLKRLTLELGGNDAAIVLDDVDPATIAPAIFRAAFVNNGQACIALKRLYVPDALYDAMCAELVRVAEAASIGSGHDPATQLGPLQNIAQLQRVEMLVEDARTRGVVATGGNRLPGAGYFFAPTIVRDIDDEAPLVREEQFGPVLPVLRYSDLDDAFARANDCEYGLGSSIWSADPARAAALASRLEAGTVWINKHMDGGPHIPLGGSKQSGIGVEFGEEGLHEFTQIQIVDINLAA